MSFDMMTRIFINQFTDLLDECKTEEAIQLLKKDRQITESGLSGVTSAIVSSLTNSTLQQNKASFDCCSNVLTFIAENCEPTLVIYEFPIFVKGSRDHVNFCTLLNAMFSCIMRLQDKSRNSNSVLHSILSYVKVLPDADDDDSEAASDRIIRTYKAITAFVEPLVEEAIKIDSKMEEGCRFGNERSYFYSLPYSLLSFFISLCEKSPYCLNQHVNEELANNIVTQAFRLTGDILYFLNIVSTRANSRERIFQIECSDVGWTWKITDMAFANFYFYVITKENYWINVPQVYNSYYILETCAYFFKILLNNVYSIPTALIFMENVIKRIPTRSVDSEMLRLEIYTKLFQPIINVMIYSNSDGQRKKAVRIFQEYVEIFNMEARYTVILYLYEIAKHSGLLSFITGMFKSSIIECLDSTPRNPQFLGKNMELLLKKVCNLPHGSSSDVVEISDEIITALNLLRFLFIRDKNNETGIWNMTDMLKNDYLNPLRVGIDLCKTHWRVKAKDLEQQKKDLAKEKDYSKLMKAHMDVTLTVGGEQLPFMPVSEKISICHQAINGLDVMESILIRVNECIDINEKFVEK